MKIIIILILFSTTAVMSQYNINNPSEVNLFPWPQGKRCAVSLTFDDARVSQIDKGIPLLNKYNIKATFYISPDRLVRRLEGWQQAIKDGHEIGNHTMSHPCTGNYAFSRENALEDYTLETIANEMDMANTFILDKLGIVPAGFAYPCGQKFVGRGNNVKSYIPLVAERFHTGRGWLDEDANDPLFCDMSQLLAMESDGKSFAALKTLVDKAAEKNRWLILAGHEIDDSGMQTTLLISLERLCQYSQTPENGIWIDTVEHIAQYIENNR